MSASDPLAELARLIGQTDPFAEFGRENARRAPPAAPPAAPSFSSADYFDAPSAPPPHPAPLQPPAYAPPPRARQPYAAGAEQLYPPPGASHPAGGPGAFEEDPYHPSNAELGPEEHGFYEDAPPPKRRMGIMAIAAVFALAVIGTAGAFGYRAMFGSPAHPARRR